MDVSSLNLHHEGYLVQLTPWKLPHGSYTMEVTSTNLHNGSSLIDHTQGVSSMR